MSVFDRISKMIPPPILHKIDRTLQRVVYHSGAAQPFQALQKRVEQLENLVRVGANDDALPMLDYLETRIDNIYANLLNKDSDGQDHAPPTGTVLRKPTLSGVEPRMSIEDVSAGPDLQRLFEHVQGTWQHFGETDQGEFYDTGRGDADHLYHALSRSGIEANRFRSCLEYGCGLGRVTRWLAPHFEQVHAYDTSRSHLSEAEQYLRSQGIANVDLNHVESVQDIFKLPKVDVVFSLIVLQHNPPPIIRLIIAEFLKALNPGGVAFFQVPTYRLGYRFGLEEYIANDCTRQDMEMHVLPQPVIFDIIRREGGQIVEVIEDERTGMRAGEVSNTFLVRRPTS
jgi:SAM-dependent methyltransferase